MIHRVSWALDAALDRFNEWFTSRGGVWHTLLVVLVIVVMERLFPHLDVNGFLLLYWLTVYSAVTQPALAMSGRISSERLQAMEERQLDTDERILAILEHHGIEDPAA